MRCAPAGRAGEAETGARRAAVLGLVAALGPIVAQIRELTAQIRAALATHPDAAIFAPLFRDPRTAICPATLIAELGDSRERYPTEAALAADAGQEPGRRRVGQAPGRVLPPCMRQAAARLLVDARRLDPQVASVGPRDLRRRESPAARTTRTRSAPWGELGRGCCELLAGRRAIR